jgi:capsular polysaccharide biosynthesis protein
MSKALRSLDQWLPHWGPLSPRGRSTEGRPDLLQVASDAGVKQTKDNTAFLRALARAVGGRPAPRLAVLVPPGRRPRELSEVLEAAYPDAHVVRVEVTEDWSEIHATLAAAGRFDVIVDDVRRGRTRNRTALFRRTFLHLEPGGVYLVRQFSLGTEDLRDGRKESVARLVTRLLELKNRTNADADTPHSDDLSLALAIGRTAMEQGHLVVRRTGETAYAKLDDAGTNRVLAERGPETGRLVRSSDPVVLRSRSVVRESPSPRNGDMPETFDVPALSVREYHDVTCLPGQVVLKDNLLLAETYRHVGSPRLRNRFTSELAPQFAVPKKEVSPQAELAGSYFHLDNEFRGHFGHALTEQVARLWAWPEAKRADPSLKALVAVNAGRRQLAGFETTLLAAAGIEPEDIELITGPTRVETLVGATPMLSNPFYVHPGIAEVWGRLGERLARGAAGQDLPKRIFCARREQTGPGVFTGQRRTCLNASLLEGVFESHGFTVVYPEEFDLADQARMFREAEVIAGYAGSAMFNLLFSDAPKHVVLVTSEAYKAKNEYLISAVLGHRMDLVWCRPETNPEDGLQEGGEEPQRNLRPFNAPFRFDPDREGRFLDGVLRDL